MFFFLFASGMTTKKRNEGIVELIPKGMGKGKDCKPTPEKAKKETRSSALLPCQRLWIKITTDIASSKLILHFPGCAKRGGGHRIGSPGSATTLHVN